jgi:hypothetical protein
MNRKVKTARGRVIDMAALAARNERAKAVGNILMNARGDRLNPDGTVKITAEELARIDQNSKSAPQQTAISDPKPVQAKTVAPEESKQNPLPEFAPEPEAVSKITRTREDGSQYMEIEYDDGSMETVEINEE